MTVVFTNAKLHDSDRHVPEMKYIPKNAEVIITTYDPDGDNTQFYADLAKADIVINYYVYLGRPEIDAMKKCKVITFQATGFNEVDFEYATEKGIIVASILDYCTQETAENAIATMMCLQRGTMLYNRSIQQDHVWNTGVVKGQKRVEGQVMGIVGLGRIGRHVARIAGKGLGMKVIAYDPFLPAEVAKACDVEVVDFDTLLAEADVVSIHMALTDENIHMFNKETFMKMKKCPILINEGRGPMVSEVDLAWALDNGYVRGAGLDMLESESPNPEYLAKCPLLGRDNVIINPHSGFVSDTVTELLFKISVENGIYAYLGEYDKVKTIRNPQVLKR